MDIWAHDLQSSYLLMKSEPVVWAGQTSGPDMAPLMAVVTALACVHMQQDIVVYWDWVMRLRVQGAIVIWLTLFFLHKLITEFLVVFQVVLEGG